MSTVIVASTSSVVGARREAKRRVGAAPSSTSIRVSVPTRDVLAHEAALAGLSLTAYVDELARRAWRERAITALRDERVAAYADPAFLAELQPWDDADDDSESAESSWSAANV